MSYRERGTQKVIRRKNDAIIHNPNTTLMQIAGLREDSRKLFDDFDTWDIWWNETKELFSNYEERLDYLKNWYVTETAPLFRDKANHYERVLTSPTAEFEFPGCRCRPETQCGLSGEACDYCKSQNSDEIPY